MMKVPYALVALALATAACSSPEAPETAETPVAPAAESGVPAEIAAAVRDAEPGITITGGEEDAANNEYEVTGTLPNGDEVEFDMVQSNGAWTVLEIQRDIEWSTAPEPVRAAAAAAPESFEPVRVIESKQAEDGAVVYELFAPDQTGGGPAMEVRWHEGQAEVIRPTS